MNARWTVVIAVALLAVQVSAKENRPLATQKDKVSYAMAVAVAKSIQRQGVEIDVKVFARGLEDALSGGKLLMSENDVRTTLSGVAGELKRKQAETAKAPVDRKAAGETFRAENAKKEGVVTLASGVQYKILKAGDGKTPTDADTVECNYRGTSIDGKEFDSSYRRGRPATVPMARVIPGWREALKLMPVGSTWQVVVPPELGYGAGGRGRRSKIGPKETLVFEIQLLGIKPQGPAAASEKTASAP